jgi:hypothetical protein
MDLSTLETLGQVAGVAGIAIGAFLFVARDLIAKNIFPTLTKAHSTKVILTLAFMAWTVALAGIGSWTYVEINKNGNGSSADTEVTSTTLPGETAWIFSGYFNIETEAFIEGPYVSVYDSNTRGQRRYVEIGDTIQLKVSRKAIIVDYKITGTSQKLVSPINAGILGEEDETGITIPKDTQLVVRDVSEGRWPDSKNAALWLRVVNVPQ